MSIGQFFESIDNYEVKAITSDWTSTEVWVNKDGITKVYYQFTSGIEEGKSFHEAYDDFINRIANIDCVETRIIRG